MPYYYFEIETTQKGWLRIEADSLADAKEDITEDGFGSKNITDSEMRLNITPIEGGRKQIDLQRM